MSGAVSLVTDPRVIGWRFLPHTSETSPVDPSGQHVHLTPDLMVPMRDGVRLAADLYRPAANGEPVPGRWPAILIRTPYSKVTLQQTQHVGQRWAEAGYACVIQDCRGRYQSEGTFYKYVHEPEDGYDTVEWVAAQDWCDGHVGTTGASYLCHVQTFMAPLRPPHLKAMFCIKGGFFNAHTSGVRQGGALEFRQMVWAFKEARVSQEAQRDPVVRAALAETSLADWLTRFPFKRGYSPISAAPAYEEYLFDQLEHGDYDDYWKQIGFNTEERLAEYADVPTVYLSSWYDIYAWSDVDFFQHLAPVKRGPIRLIMGPWEHTGEERVAGEVDFGPEARLAGNLAADRFALERRWFDRWLKGIQNGVDAEPAVRYFAMGGGSGGRSPEGHLQHGGTWRAAAGWPLPDAQPVSLYLQPGGRLADQAPEAGQASSGYTHDPAHPVPTLGGNMIRYENILWPGAYDQRERPEFFLCKPPYLPLATRPDVLVFRTRPLDRELEVTGAVTVRLHVSSSAPDTDFTVKLIDEYPPSQDYPRGFAMNVTHGIRRCRYRDGREAGGPMLPEKAYALDITCYPTSNRFQPGHCIRLDVASSNYPHFDLNTNTGEPFGASQRLQAAHNRVHHDQEHPSRVVLPVIRGRA
jgi:putative CocE/NonD family hydrolase